MITVELGYLIFGALFAAFIGFLIGGICGLHEGVKMAQQDIRRLKRQMNGYKYDVGDIVEVTVPQEDNTTVFATISRRYHLLDGDHDYQLLLPGGLHHEVDEEDILQRISRRVV